MNKLKALEAFDDQDGSFEKGAEFEVNDERANILTRTGKAERVPYVAPVVPNADAPEPEQLDGEQRVARQLGVPRQESEK